MRLCERTATGEVTTGSGSFAISASVTVPRVCGDALAILPQRIAERYICLYLLTIVLSVEQAVTVKRTVDRLDDIGPR
jgi:hypothetical protein